MTSSEKMLTVLAQQARKDNQLAPIVINNTVKVVNRGGCLRLIFWMLVILFVLAVIGKMSHP